MSHVTIILEMFAVQLATQMPGPSPVRVCPAISVLGGPMSGCWAVKVSAQ